MAEDGTIDLFIDPAQRVGVWANDVSIAFSQHEFTLDFLRLDHASGSPPRRGAVAARVAVSPAFVLTLIRELETYWQTYAAGEIPPGLDDDEL